MRSLIWDEVYSRCICVECGKHMHKHRDKPRSLQSVTDRLLTSSSSSSSSSSTTCASDVPFVNDDTCLSLPFRYLSKAFVHTQRKSCQQKFSNRLRTIGFPLPCFLDVFCHVTLLYEDNDNTEQLIKLWSPCWLHCHNEDHRLIHYHMRSKLHPAVNLGDVEYNDAVKSFKPFSYKAPLIDNTTDYVSPTCDTVCYNFKKNKFISYVLYAIHI